MKQADFLASRLIKALDGVWRGFQNHLTALLLKKGCGPTKHTKEHEKEIITTENTKEAQSAHGKLIKHEIQQSIRLARSFVNFFCQVLSILAYSLFTNNTNKDRIGAVET
jgi:hypothetical protein